MQHSPKLKDAAQKLYSECVDMESIHCFLRLHPNQEPINAIRNLLQNYLGIIADEALEIADLLITLLNTKGAS